LTRFFSPTPSNRHDLPSQDKNNAEWDTIGGLNGVASALNTSLVDGLNPSTTDDQSIDARREVFGANKLPTIPNKNFFVLWFINLKDPIIMLLMGAALVSRL
jgi:magnesium-transporting ATPase (P-type)